MGCQITQVLLFFKYSSFFFLPKADVIPISIIIIILILGVLENLGRLKHTIDTTLDPVTTICGFVIYKKQCEQNKGRGIKFKNKKCIEKKMKTMHHNECKKQEK